MRRANRNDGDYDGGSPLLHLQLLEAGSQNV